jgi:hypothetical protein
VPDYSEIADTGLWNDALRRRGDLNAVNHLNASITKIATTRLRRSVGIYLHSTNLPPSSPEVPISRTQLLFPTTAGEIEKQNDTVGMTKL